MSARPPAKRAKHEHTPHECPGEDGCRFWPRWDDFRAKLLALPGQGLLTRHINVARTLPRKEYKGLMAEMDGHKGRSCNRLADHCRVLPVLKHCEDIDLRVYNDASARDILEGDILHQVFVAQLLAWLTEGLLAASPSMSKGLLERYSDIVLRLLMRLDEWSCGNDHRRSRLLSILVMEDVWALIVDIVASDAFDDSVFTLCEIERVSILFENPPSPGLLRGLMLACDREGPGYFDMLMMQFYRDSPSYVESLPVGALGHVETLYICVEDHRFFELSQHPRTVAEMVRLAGGCAAVKVFGTMRFMVEAVLPALRARQWRGDPYLLETQINDGCNKERTPCFRGLMEGAWDLPIARWTLSVRGYLGPETFRDMVGLLSAFDLRSLHKERVELLKPAVDPVYEDRPDYQAYPHAAAFMNNVGWHEAILSPR